MAGRPERVSDEEILRVFSDSPDPVLSASEVSDSIEIKYPGTKKRVDDLADRGLLCTKRVGQGRAFWLSEYGEKYLSGELGADDLEEGG